MKLVILAATLPSYRKDFYEGLNFQLKKRDWELIVIHGTSFFQKAIKFDSDPGYKAMPIEMRQFKFLGYDIVWWKGILRQIRKIKPKIVIIHAGTGNISLWYLQFFCYLTNIKIGMWSSGYVRQEITGLKKRFRAKIKYSFFKWANFIITYGSQFRDELYARGFKKSKIFVAQNTINVEKILKQDFNRKKKYNHNEVVFLFVGALIPQKNLDLAIKAISIIVREKYNIKFYIIGKGVIKDNLKSLIVEEGMKDKIIILDSKYGTELTSFFVNADVFLLPGTGGLAVNEAMAYGLPIISTRGDGTIVDLVYEGVNGFLLNDKPSVENIYEACKKFIELNPSEISKMRKLSKKVISEKATLKNMISVFVSVIFNETLF